VAWTERLIVKKNAQAIGQLGYTRERERESMAKLEGFQERSRRCVWSRDTRGCNAGGIGRAAATFSKICTKHASASPSLSFFPMTASQKWDCSTRPFYPEREGCWRGVHTMVCWCFKKKKN
jgi:hypothetical protein